VNVTTSVSGTYQGRALLNDAVSMSGRVFWVDSQWSLANNKVLNGTFYVDNVVDSTRNNPGDIAYLFNDGPKTYSRGPHSVKAESNNHAPCSSVSSFIVQSEPTAAVSQKTFTHTFKSSDTNLTVTVPMNASYSTDTEYSLLKNAPEIYWDVEGQRINSSSATVVLGVGSRNAKFTVKDGVYTKSDSMQILINDELNVAGIHHENWCVNTTAKTQFMWDPSPGTIRYEMEYLPYMGSWTSLGSTTNTSKMLSRSSYTTETESFRVRACSTSRCGEYAYSNYIKPACNNGGGVPN